jgi:lactoylglutathione lyase
MHRDTRAVVEALDECFNSRNYDGLDDLVAEDMVNHAAGPQGREGWKAIWRAVVTCFPDVVSQTRAIIVDGDRAAVHLVLSGTHRASAMPLLEGIAPTGARVELGIHASRQARPWSDRRAFRCSR